MRRRPSVSANAEHATSLKAIVAGNDLGGLSSPRRMPPSCEAESERHAVTRRHLLIGTLAAAVLAGASAPAHVLSAAAITPDAELAGLERKFLAALDAYEAARQHFNRCEAQYFELRPRVPKLLTRKGPLGHLLVDRWSHWSTAGLRRVLKGPEHRPVWDEARAALPVARAYEARVRRMTRETDVVAAERANNAAIEVLREVADLILAAPAGSLEDLAIKARVVKTWGRPEWWDSDEGYTDTYERLAAEILDAVMAMAEDQPNQRAG